MVQLGRLSIRMVHRQLNLESRAHPSRTFTTAPAGAEPGGGTVTLYTAMLCCMNVSECVRRHTLGWTVRVGRPPRVGVKSNAAGKHIFAYFDCLPFVKYLGISS